MAVEDIQQYLVSEAPPSVYYIPNFINSSEASDLLRLVYAAPRPKWTQLAHRRLQNWGGIPHPKGMLVEQLPDWLVDCSRRVSSLGVFEDKLPNHVLVNEYSAGQGIMPHEDGPLYYPTVTTISLGSHTVLDFYKPISDTNNDASLQSRYTLSILLEPQSLLVLQHDMYTGHLHGIREQSEDTVSAHVCNFGHLASPVAVGDVVQRSTRVSLTIRHVPKTLKVKLKLGK